MPLPLAPTALPLLLALTPLPSDTYAPVVAPSSRLGGNLLIDAAPVETFDPIGRAQLIAVQMPRLWNGSYLPFQGAGPVPVQLSLAPSSAVGQMVVLRGRITIAGSEAPVQGNLNAKSDQLDLLVLGDAPPAELGFGGGFQGLQGLSLSGWNGNRLTSMGGRLQLVPVPGSNRLAAEGSEAGEPIRGLW